MSKLHTWFGFSYASFLVLPRVLMQEMPVEWQDKMADLLNIYDETFDTSEICSHTRVLCCDVKNKLIPTPEELLNYRHPAQSFINECKIKKEVQDES